MKIDIRPGTYVVAVSGGVDSMVLLHALHRLANEAGFELRLVVAHFDHGIREDSCEDRRLVEQAAHAYGLSYIYEHGHLGAGASEAQAREARYAFLRRVRAGQGADAIMTAHHQDDVLETIIINMVRGTGSRGLSSLRSDREVVRPLLHLTKQELREYAVRHEVTCREDSTNQDEHYLRNYIRRQVMPKLGQAERVRLLAASRQAAMVNAEIERLLAPHTATARLNRQWFIGLPHAVAREAMAVWLRRHGIGFDRKAVERLVVFAKTARPGKTADVNKMHRLQANRQTINIMRGL